MFKINPVSDPRWSKLLAKHQHASLFHTSAWLTALALTYEYRPIVYTTSGPGEELANGIVFCEVQSLFTGRRLVSLPFSDHCTPLVSSDAELENLLEGIWFEFAQRRWKYVELRPLIPLSGRQESQLGLGQCFAMHVIDTRPDLDQLYRNMHKSSIRDRVRRAERDGVTCEKGSSESLVATFYHLLMMTRRRHGIPPQPLAWFRNLLKLLRNNLTIYVASKDSQPLASIVTISFNGTVTYKYGCSDSRFHSSGAVPFLLWRSLQDAKALGAEEYDLGRSDFDNPGLIEFKERLGGKLSTLNYYRFPNCPAKASTSLARRVAGRLVSNLPDVFLTSIGRLLYRHIG